MIDPQERSQRTELDDVLDYHEGDARAAVQTLLDDCRHLRQQLALTEGVMSAGITRGWRPTYDRGSVEKERL